MLGIGKGGYFIVFGIKMDKLQIWGGLIDYCILICIWCMYYGFYNYFF